MPTIPTTGPLPRLRRLLANGLPVRVVCYGDSISEVKPGWNGGASAPERNWGALFAARLAAAWPGSTVSVHHFAIGGQNSYEGLGRQHQLPELRPDLVLLAFGASDCSQHWLEPDETRLALTILANEVTVRTGADVVLVGSGGDGHLQPHFRHLDGTLVAQRGAAEAAGIPFVDVRSAILAATGGGERWAEYHVNRGNCHPTDRGHAVWAEAVWTSVEATLASGPVSAATRQHQLTPQPPRGWNSYDSFGCFVNERRALDNLRVFVERLKPHGYDTFVIDGGWYRSFDLGGREFPGKDDAYQSSFDSHARCLPAACFFPRGFAPVAEACHAAGVKFGIHMMRGIPKAAVEANLPILGTQLRARDIANTNDICTWCPDMFGVDMAKPGAQAYYDSLIALFASWGVDFLKFDDIIGKPPEIAAVQRAIAGCGRDIVLSLSPGNGHKPDGWPVYLQANMVRTTGDIWDTREDFRWVFGRWQEFMPLIDRLPHGCWLDMDMIPFGELQVWNDTREQIGDILMNGKGTRRMSGLNAAQQRTFMTMRALAASPLMMGGNLPATDAMAFAIITDPGMLACNANGVTGRLIGYTDWTSTWLTPHRERPKAGWFGIFNRDGKGSREVVVDAAALGIPPTSRLHDIWNRHDLGDLRQPLRLTLPPDEVLFVRYG
jgi:alpha-galactosidase